MVRFTVLLAAALLVGCVPPPPGTVVDLAPRTTAVSGVFGELDPGGKDTAGLHFRVKAYGTDHAQRVLDLAEDQYNRIMQDTNLYSFRPAGLYSIVVYANQDEYRKKTGQPNWSGGVTVGNAIYTFESAGLGMTVAHEMTHLVFNEYMGGSRVELRWLNEGLAVYEEWNRAAVEGYVGGLTYEQKGTLRNQALPFDQMIVLAPAGERERRVSLWYQQVGDVVKFMIERGGRNGFGQFIAALERARPTDECLRSSFPGVFNNMGDVEGAWRRSL